MSTPATPAQPRSSSRPREIAVCPVGMSPAVVTETLYALAVQQNPKVIRERIHLLARLDAHRNYEWLEPNGS